MCGTPKSSFNERVRRALENVSTVVQIIGLGLAYGTPALLYCLVLNQALLFYVIVGHLVVGVGGGVWLYKRRPDGFSTNAPAEQAPTIPHSTFTLAIRKLVGLRPAHEG